MTKKVPGHIKRNFVYRRVWNDIKRYNKNANFIFVGDVGSGKSWAALKFAEDLDPDFNSDRVVFGVKDLLRLVIHGDSTGKKLRRGSVIVFDEISGSEKGADARSFMSKENKRMSYFVTTSRARGYVTIYCSPSLSQVDYNVRRIGLTGIVIMRTVDIIRKTSCADFYWKSLSPILDKSYNPRARINKDSIVEQIYIALASKNLIKEYEIKKANFLTDSFKRWEKQLEVKQKKGKLSIPQIVAMVRENLKDFIRINKNGEKIISASSLVVHHGLSNVMAYHIKNELEKEMSKDSSSIS